MTSFFRIIIQYFGLFAFGTVTAADAASREELAAIHVQKASDFQYWEKNAPSKEALVKYVKDVTNPKSKNYIPPEDRIATFDLDGTLYCETAPYYFQEMMFLHRALEDDSFKATPAMKDISNAARLITCPWWKWFPISRTTASKFIWILPVSVKSSAAW